MNEKIGVFLMGLGICGCVGLEIMKYLNPRGFVKPPKIVPDFDFDEFIIY